jgi:hypothetical protein
MQIGDEVISIRSGARYKVLELFSDGKVKLKCLETTALAAAVAVGTIITMHFNRLQLVQPANVVQVSPVGVLGQDKPQIIAEREAHEQAILDVIKQRKQLRRFLAGE